MSIESGRSGQRFEGINFNGMVHAPENEQGVVLLFARARGGLGLPVIDIIETGFPDECPTIAGWKSIRRSNGVKKG